MGPTATHFMYREQAGMLLFADFPQQPCNLAVRSRVQLHQESVSRGTETRYQHHQSSSCQLHVRPFQVSVVHTPYTPYTPILQGLLLNAITCACSVAADEDWPPRFQKLALTFQDGTQLAFCDPRRFGKFKMVKGGGAASSTVKELGFDPLTDMPELAEFIQIIKKRAKGATRLKPLLLDQVWMVVVS